MSAPLGQYEYKCVAASAILEVLSTNVAPKAIASFADAINKECTDRLEFYSMEQLTVNTMPGCLSIFFGAKPPTVYNMLVFRRPR